MSYRNDTVPYDLTLLYGTERQGGYNVDLLNDGRNRRAPTLPDPGPVPTVQRPLADGYSPGAVALARKGGQLEKATEPAVAEVPWYRTRWGIMAIVIAIILIIGVVVGGAVGGTHHSSRKSNHRIGSGDSASSNSTGNGGNSSNPSSGGSASATTNNGVTPAGPGITPSSTSEGRTGSQSPSPVFTPGPSSGVS